MHDITDIKKSLWFPEIDQREEGIKDAHAQTFSWVLDKGSFRTRHFPREGDPPNTSPFIPWLKKHDGSIFWISGKAGSTYQVGALFPLFGLSRESKGSRGSRDSALGYLKKTELTQNV